MPDLDALDEALFDDDIGEPLAEWSLDEFGDDLPSLRSTRGAFDERDH